MTSEAQRLQHLPRLSGLPAAEVEHLIAAVRAPDENSELTYGDWDPRAATGGRALNFPVSHQPLDGLVVDVAALETPDLILHVRGHDGNPPSLCRPPRTRGALNRDCAWNRSAGSCERASHRRARRHNLRSTSAPTIRRTREIGNRKWAVGAKSSTLGLEAALVALMGAAVAPVLLP
jgi:hypothetical protein